MKKSGMLGYVCNPSAREAETSRYLGLADQSLISHAESMRPEGRGRERGEGGERDYFITHWRMTEEGT